jgi:hypothetical protein
MYSSIHFLTSALDGGEWSASRPGRFTPRERAPGTAWIGGWVGPRAVLYAVVKRKIPSPRRESNPRTPIVQSVAQRYTDWAITALGLTLYTRNFWPWVPHGTRCQDWLIVSCTWLLSSGFAKWDREPILRIWAKPPEASCSFLTCGSY